MNLYRSLGARSIHDLGLLPTALVLVALVLSPTLRAQTVWSNVGTGDWTTGSNWSAGAPNSSTDATINNGGTATLTGTGEAGELLIGSGGGTSGSLSIDGGSLTANSNAVIGFYGSTGSADIGSGTWSVSSIFIVGHTGGTGSLSITGGEVTSPTSQVGYGGDGTVTVSGGSWSAGSLYVGFAATENGAGVLTITGGTVTASSVALNYNLGYEKSSTGTINLNGGVLETGGINELTGTGGGQVNFNGGTLRAAANTANLFTGFSAGDVQIGATGAVIDTQNFAVGLNLALQGAGGLTKLGAGTLTLGETNTYVGATAVNAGTLNLSGSIATSSLTTVASGATLTGTGTTGPLTIASGGTLAPGNSPGALSAGDTTFGGGGNFIWEINSVDGNTGEDPGWDTLNVSGTLTITASSGTPFTVFLASLTAGNTAGEVFDFNPNANYAFTLATTTLGIIGFDADAFEFNSAGFANSFSGSWSVEQSGGDLNLIYTAAVPEPSTYAAIAGAVMLGFVFWRRRRQQAQMRS